MNVDSDRSDTVLVMGYFNFSDAATWHENDNGFDFVPVIGESQCEKSIIVHEATTKLSDCGLFQLSDFKNISGNVLDLIYTKNPELTVVNKADFLMLPAHKSDKFYVSLMCLVECAPKINPNNDSNTV